MCEREYVCVGEMIDLHFDFMLTKAFMREDSNHTYKHQHGTKQGNPIYTFKINLYCSTIIIIIELTSTLTNAPGATHNGTCRTTHSFICREI